MQSYPNTVTDRESVITHKVFTCGACGNVFTYHHRYSPLDASGQPYCWTCAQAMPEGERYWWCGTCGQAKPPADFNGAYVVCASCQAAG